VGGVGQPITLSLQLEKALIVRNALIWFISYKWD
jgi:hypothetical protein